MSFGSLSLGRLSLGYARGAGGGAPYTGPDIALIVYGQSNAGGLYTNNDASETAPAAADGTMWWDGSAWGSVPNAGGIRHLLNGIKAEFPDLTVGALGAAVSGMSISQLSKDAGSTPDAFGDLAAQIQASGIRNASDNVIVWHQGEGEANTPTNRATYISLLDTLHGDIVAVLGKSKAQVPLVLATLGNTTNAISVDSGWDYQQGTLLAAAGQLANVYMSHSNMDVVRIDTYHYDEASHGRAGDRYAQTINWLLGVGTGPAYFSIDTSAVTGVDATTTTVDVTHIVGTDIASPISAYTGFEVSEDNGSTWETCTGVRTDSNTITLTHASIGMTTRLLRYQYGELPDTSDLVLDNSSLAVPLLPSGGTVTVQLPDPPPVPSYLSAQNHMTMGTTGPFTTSSLSIGTASATRRVFVWVDLKKSSACVVTSATFTPNSGSPITPTILTGPTGASILTAIVPEGTSMTVTFSASVSADSQGDVVVWSVNDDLLTSTTPVDAKFASNSSATSLSITNLTTTDGGFILAMMWHAGFASATISIGGDDSYSTRINKVLSSGGKVTFGDASGTPTSAAARTVAATYASAGTNRLKAVSFR